jgi:hypothetical protein
MMCINCGRQLQVAIDEPSRHEKRMLSMMLRGLDERLAENSIRVLRYCGCGYWRKETWVNGAILACKERLVIPAVDLR